MASTMATMAILNTKCTKPTFFPKPTIQTRPNTLLKLTTNLPKGLISNAHPAAATALAGAFFAALSSSEPALAAQQIAELADGGDNRGLALLLPIIPAIAWVLFNILQPALNQLNRMRAEKAVVVGLGLGALAWTAPPSSDAGEIAAVAEAAAGDNRGTLILLVVLPAIGWVLFNILQPALNQLNRMRSR